MILRPIQSINATTDLPVVLSPRMATFDSISLKDIVFAPASVFALFAAFAASIFFTPALAQGLVQAQAGILDILAKWTPLLFWGPPGEIGGFVLNVLVSFVAMGIGTLLGLWLGLCADISNRAGTASCVAGHAVISKHSLAGSPVLFYAFVAVSNRNPWMDDPAARMAKSIVCPIASDHGQYLGSRSWRRQFNTD